MAEANERVYKIPLRKAQSVPRQFRARQAVTLVKRFLERHLKGAPSLGQKLNEELWAGSIKKPPAYVRVHAFKDGEVVRAELVGVEFAKPKQEETKKTAKTKTDEKKEAAVEKKPEATTETADEAKHEHAKTAKETKPKKPVEKKEE